MPIAISTPRSPGALIKVRASKSVAAIVIMPLSFKGANNSVEISTEPSFPGYWNNAPKASFALNSFKSTTSTLMPNGLALALTIEMVCGKQFLSTRKVSLFDFEDL